MLEQIVKIVTFFITPMAGFIILSNFLKSSIKIKKVYAIILIILLASSNFLSFTVQYQIVTTLITFLLSIIVFKLIFNLKLVQSIISVCILFVVLTVGDLICSLIFVAFFDVVTVRSNIFLMLTCNVVVAIFACIISCIPPIKNGINKFIEKTSNYERFNRIIFLILSIIVISIILYIMSKNFNFILEYIIAICILIILFILFIVLIQENNNNVQLSNKYDMLFEYVQNFEDIIESNHLLNHEYKNQLATIRHISSKKEINQYIDNILNCNMNVSDDLTMQLKFIPKGGLKGLLYYKLLLAKNRNLNVNVDISKEVKNDLKLLNDTQLKILSNVLGIYFDNAIEAAEETNLKELSLEIYKISNSISIVIANSIKDNIDLSLINKKGYSSKGTGRGNGLYYSEKLLSNTSDIYTESQVLEKYFIKKVIIKTNSTN